METLDAQLFGIAKGIKSGDFNIPDIGDIVPASLMLHELNGLHPTGCSYMNTWGCEHLGTWAEEINELGEAYYDRYFVKEEILINFEGIGNYLLAGDFDKQYNFFQRVKLYSDSDYTWFYIVCKWKFYNENGPLKESYFIKDGKLQGEWKRYYENGQLRLFMVNLIDGQAEGEARHYYESGKLEAIYNFVKGVGHGEAQEYHENGQLSLIGSVVNRKKENEWKYFDESGRLTKTEIYKNDELIETREH